MYNLYWSNNMTPSSRTAEESKADRIQAMGPELGAIYDALWEQVVWLHRKWFEYVVLFGTEESRVALLNDVAPSFTKLIQDALWENILLHIARLTDLPKSAGKWNFTIQQVATEIIHAGTKAIVVAKIAEALSASEFCRDWRNRHIEHRDLHLALKSGAEPLKSGSRQKVSETLKTLSAVLNATQSHYLGSTTFFDCGVETGGARSLLHFLDLGLHAEQSNRDLFKSGRHDPNKYRPRNF